MNYFRSFLPEICGLAKAAENVNESFVHLSCTTF